ncbi:hypothetical protein AD998_02940 [bacterium 336/3]|nr:hypothetical protein AD998_02940 [bacterium 336/3]
MLNIQFVEMGNDSYVTINGIEDKNADVIGQSHYCKLYRKEAIDIIKTYTLNDIQKYFEVWVHDIFIDDWQSGHISALFDDSAEIEIQISVENWSNLYSITDFIKEFEKIAKTHNNIDFFLYQNADNAIPSFGFHNLKVSKTSSIGNIENGIIAIIKEFIELATISLLSKIDKNKISLFFNFPEHIKVSCKQYLVYFAQFLMDLGIDADTEIKEDAGKTLFRVIPKDGIDALEKIREALQIYLNPPTEIILSPVSLNEDIAIMQWKANIMHLQSQLTLANSIIQAKDATIQSLQLSNYQFQEILKTKEPQNNDTEDVIKDLVSVKKYDGSAFSINLPEFLRRLKRLFK